jgi:hypothetical protein
MVQAIATMEFIFMLTHHDVTVPNALEVLQKVSKTGLKCAGCKDIGLEIPKLRLLFSNMKAAGMKSFLEVVTMKEEEHFRGVDIALEIGAGHLIGGMPEYTEKTIQYLKRKKNPPKLFPYIGKILGHPCLLRGSLEEIVEDAKRTQKIGADGINLLAYRYDGDVRELIQKVMAAVQVPLIVAGNVDSVERIRELKELGVWAFTIGGAIMEKKFAATADEPDQIKAVLKEVAR